MGRLRDELEQKNRQLKETIASYNTRLEELEGALLAPEEAVIAEGPRQIAYIVKDGKVITRHLSNEILAGCTRRALMRLAKEEGVEIVERKFTVEEALAADEAFLTSASQFVMPIVEIDGHRIGGGQPGPVVRKLRELFLKEASA